jgi:hypothetical protein
MKNPFLRFRNEPPAAATPPQPIVVVSGLPRSGTSMMMKMLAAGGLEPLTDELRAADVDNPKGYYEFERVKGLDKGDTSWLPMARGKVVKVISYLLQYLPPNETYQVVFLRRNLEEILASQRKMIINRGEDPNQMDDARVAEMFTRHVDLVERWLWSRPNVETLYVHYSDMLAGPEAEIQRVARFLGRDLNEAAMAQVIDPVLYRNRQLATA